MISALKAHIKWNPFIDIKDGDNDRGSLQSDSMFGLFKKEENGYVNVDKKEIKTTSIPKIFDIPYDAYYQAFIEIKKYKIKIKRKKSRKSSNVKNIVKMKTDEDRMTIEIGNMMIKKILQPITKQLSYCTRPNYL